MFVITEQLIYIPDATEYRIAKYRDDNSFRIIIETPSRVYTIIDEFGTTLSDDAADFLTDIFLEEIKGRVISGQNIDMDEIYEQINESISKVTVGITENND